MAFSVAFWLLNRLHDHDGGQQGGTARRWAGFMGPHTTRAAFTLLALLARVPVLLGNHPALAAACPPSPPSLLHAIPLRPRCRPPPPPPLPVMLHHLKRRLQHVRPPPTAALLAAAAHRAGRLLAAAQETRAWGWGVGVWTGGGGVGLADGWVVVMVVVGVAGVGGGGWGVRAMAVQA